MRIEELALINAFFGFCTPMGDTWPSPLVPLGYEVVGVQRELTTTLNGRDKTVVVDVLCGSQVLQHVLCVEAKSATVHSNQARAYATLSGQRLAVQGVIPTGVSADQLSHDVVYATASSHAPQVQHGLTFLGLQFPILAADQSAFRLTHGAFCQPELNKVFAAKVVVANHEWPRHFVPFTATSSDAEKAPRVMSTLLQFLQRGGSFTIHDFVRKAVPHYDYCGTAEQRQFRKSVGRLLDRVAREELHGEFRRIGSDPEWEVMGKPATTAQRLEALQQRARQFVYRLEHGIDFMPNQPPLFEIEDLVDEGDLPSDRTDDGRPTTKPGGYGRSASA